MLLSQEHLCFVWKIWAFIDFDPEVLTNSRGHQGAVPWTYDTLNFFLIESYMKNELELVL